MKAAAFIIVAWNLHFARGNILDTWHVYQHERYFKDMDSAQEFIRNAPQGKYECIESIFGQRGVCYVSDIGIAKELKK